MIVMFVKQRQQAAGASPRPTASAHLPQSPEQFSGMAPMAARRAKPVQRGGCQGLRGNPDACNPEHGSACDISARKTGGDARLVFALSV
mgnify:CR=1 FL=1